MQNSPFPHPMSFGTRLGQQPCTARSLSGTRVMPWPYPQAQLGVPLHRGGGRVPMAGTKRRVAMPWGVHLGQLIAFGVPVCSHGARSKAGDEGQQVVAAVTMWPSSGPDSNFPSRSFWSSFWVFFPGRVVTLR